MMACLVKLAYQSWTWDLCLLLGTITSATDPVAVVALLRELGAKVSLSTTIEGESLLNDGTAVVIFSVLMEISKGLISADDSLLVLWHFFRMAVGGPVIGMIFGEVALYWISHVFNDVMVEISISITVAYLSFYVSEFWCHSSGVLTVVFVGLAFSAKGRQMVSPEVRTHLPRSPQISSDLPTTTPVHGSPLTFHRPSLTFHRPISPLPPGLPLPARILGDPRLRRQHPHLPHHRHRNLLPVAHRLAVVRLRHLHRPIFGRPRHPDDYLLNHLRALQAHPLRLDVEGDAYRLVGRPPRRRRCVADPSNSRHLHIRPLRTSSQPPAPPSPLLTSRLRSSTPRRTRPRPARHVW